MKQKFTGTKRRNMTGWAFLLPATILIFAMSFYPMIQAFILSFKSGIGNNLVWSGLSNYKRLLGDGVFKTAMVNNFVYLIILDQLLAKGMNRTDEGNRQPVDLIAQMTVVGLFFQTAPNPLAHVIGGFVGKSNHQQLIDIEIRIFFQHFDNAVNQYRCLPRAS